MPSLATKITQQNKTYQMKTIFKNRNTFLGDVDIQVKPYDLLWYYDLIHPMDIRNFIRTVKDDDDPPSGTQTIMWIVP